MSDNHMKQVFSNNLNKFLKQNNKTQSDLYKYMNVTSSTVSYWCTGQKMPRMDKIKKIANFLNVEFNDLIQDDSDEQTIPDDERYFSYVQQLRKRGVTDSDFESILKMYDIIKANKS